MLPLKQIHRLPARLRVQAFQRQDPGDHSIMMAEVIGIPLGQEGKPLVSSTASIADCAAARTERKPVLGPDFTQRRSRAGATLARSWPERLV